MAKNAKNTNETTSIAEIDALAPETISSVDHERASLDPLPARTGFEDSASQRMFQLPLFGELLLEAQSSEENGRMPKDQEATDQCVGGDDEYETYNGYSRWTFDEMDPLEVGIYEAIEQMERERDGDHDWVNDETEPGGMEKIRRRFVAIEDTEQLSLELIDGEWWDCIELRDELRRACSGPGEFSRYLARRIGFEFMVGNLRRLASCGDGPLSTPLDFESKYPAKPAWNEKIIMLNEPSRPDALELRGCFSFMMH